MSEVDRAFYALWDSNRKLWPVIMAMSINIPPWTIHKKFYLDFSAYLSSFGLFCFQWSKNNISTFLLSFRAPCIARD